MREDYPKLFGELDEEGSDLRLNSRTNFSQVGENCNSPISRGPFEAQTLNPRAPSLVKVYKRRDRGALSSHTLFTAKPCPFVDLPLPPPPPPSSQPPPVAGVVEVSFPDSVFRP